MKALETALTVTTDVGATWDSARIRSRLRRLGVRRRPSAVERPKTGLESLTRTEAAVARLAAEGNTDRQIAEKLFISPHTAHTHLRHIFEKLGVNSRVHLSRIIDNRSALRRRNRTETTERRPRRVRLRCLTTVCSAGIRRDRRTDRP